MKICQVVPRYLPYEGGVETHVRQISVRLADLGHEVTVLTADAGGPTDPVERRDGIVVRRHRSVSPGGAYHLAPGIARAVRRSGADVVHAHNYHSLPLVFASLGVRGERFVATPHYHGGSASRFRDSLLTLYRPVGGRALRRADVIVAVSRWERRALRSDFGLDPTVIPNGVDLDRFEDAAPEPRDRPFVLYVGRLERYKGVQYAIRALAELDGWELVVAGDGPYRGGLERIASDADVADRVDYLGHVADERLPGLLAGATTFVALSDFEAYGMTVAEAIAAGTPCVVYEAGALAEWTENPGVVGVPERSPGAVAGAVLSARDLVPDRSQLVDWDETVARLIECYDTS